MISNIGRIRIVPIIRVRKILYLSWKISRFAWSCKGRRKKPTFHGQEGSSPVRKSGVKKVGFCLF